MDSYEEYKEEKRKENHRKQVASFVEDLKHEITQLEMHVNARILVSVVTFLHDEAVALREKNEELETRIKWIEMEDEE